MSWSPSKLAFLGPEDRGAADQFDRIQHHLRIVLGYTQDWPDAYLVGPRIRTEVSEYGPNLQQESISISSTGVEIRGRVVGSMGFAFTIVPRNASNQPSAEVLVEAKAYRVDHQGVLVVQMSVTPAGKLTRGPLLTRTLEVLTVVQNVFEFVESGKL